MSSSPPFKLSAQLVGHEADVRAVLFPSPETVVSSSRDSTVRIWNRDSQSPPTFSGRITRQAAAYVNSLTYVKPSPDHPNGLIAAGEMDGLLEVTSPTALPADNAERLLVGHANNVCTLGVAPSGRWIVSAGWDSKAIIWDTDKWNQELVLDHDSKTVWSVLVIDEHTIATGATDSNIRIFDLRAAVAGEVAPKSIIYTPDVIRALCRAPAEHPSGADIVSASNDFVIRLWKFNGQQVGEMHGHESYIYSLAGLPTGEILSTGEDRTLRVWSGTECVQTITHPAISVWTVATCSESGDVVTGASDGVARIFTRSDERAADAETLKMFDESVKASAIPQQSMGRIDKSKLPGPEFLQTRSGKKEGQVQMIKEHDGSVTAHQWSMSAQQWVSIGSVVDSVGSSGKKTEYQGQSYDYVFDVDIEDGKPPLKLPYNVTENPYDRAAKFLAENNLPTSYLENTAKFIVENTQGASIGTETSEAPAQQSTQAQYGEPKLLPQQEYLSLLAAKHEAIVNKLLSINATMISSGRKEGALNPPQQGAIRTLQQDFISDSPISEPSILLLVNVIKQWDYTDILAPLDLLRCLAAKQEAAKYSDPSHGSILKVACHYALNPPDGQNVNENSAMMALRTIVNLFCTEAGRKTVATDLEASASSLERVLGLSSGAEAVGKFNRNVQMAAATALINLAVLAHKTAAVTAPLRGRILRMAGVVLGEQSDSEVLYRGLVALGTLVVADREGVEGEKATLRKWVAGAVERGSERKVKDVGAEVLALL